MSAGSCRPCGFAGHRIRAPEQKPALVAAGSLRNRETKTSGDKFKPRSVDRATMHVPCAGHGERLSLDRTTEHSWTIHRTKRSNVRQPTSLCENVASTIYGLYPGPRNSGLHWPVMWRAQLVGPICPPALRKSFPYLFISSLIEFISRINVAQRDGSANANSLSLSHYRIRRARLSR